MEKQAILERVRQALELPDRKLKMPFLFYFFGIPGSGKSKLAAELQAMIPCVVIGTDWIALHHKLDQTEHYHWTFEIADELTRECLQGGYSVILDSNLDKVQLRKQACQMAERAGARPIGFWVHARKSVLLKRQEERRLKTDLRGESLFYISEEALQAYEDAIEPPQAGEAVYRMNGELEFEKQRVDLFQQLGVNG